MSEKRGREIQTTPKNQDAKAQGHDEGSKVGGGGCCSRRVRVQPIRSMVVVDVDEEFSWC